MSELAKNTDGDREQGKRISSAQSSHRVGKRNYWTGWDFVKDVRDRVKLPVQIATDNFRHYPFLIREHFGYEGFSFGQETKIFGEPEMTDGMLARLGRNEGVRKLKTAERKAVIGSPDLGSLTTSHIERVFLERSTRVETIPAQGPRILEGFGRG
jgi:hypothetical protein